jgi:hypothetical protein
MNKDLSYSIRELYDYVRQALVFPGSNYLEKRLKQHQSVDLWLSEEKLSVGVHKVRSLVLYAVYVEWCKARNLAKKSIVSVNAFGARLKEIYPHSKDRSKTFYHLNKDFPQYEEEIEIHAKKKYGKEAQKKKQKKQ